MIFQLWTKICFHCHKGAFIVYIQLTSQDSQVLLCSCATFSQSPAFTAAEGSSILKSLQLLLTQSLSMIRCL